LKRDELEQARQRALVAERELAEARARRPWIVVAAAALVVGLAVSLVLYRNASRERDNATRQTAIAGAINQFLSNDLLGRSNPFKTGKAEETLVDAVNQASPGIDRQFKDAPLVAARLHQTIARALDSRTNYPNARLEYDRAAALFDQAEGPHSQDGILLRLQRASMEARTYEADSLPFAKKILADQEALLPKIAEPRPDLLVWLATARAMVALIGNNAKTAVEQFQIAFDKANTIPDFDTLTKLTLQQRLAFSYIRLGDGPKAEQLSKELITAFANAGEAQNPSLLRVRLNLAQAYMIQGKHKEAIEETTSIYPTLVNTLGPDHELSMQALTTRAQSEGSLGLYDDSERDDMAIYKLALVKQGPLSFFTVATLSDASLAQCRAGHFVPGEINARTAYENSRKAFGDRSGLTGGTAYALAACLMGLSKFDEAAKLLEGIDKSAVAQLAGISDWGANVDLALAEIAFRRADYVSARKLVQSATPAFTRADAEAYQKHRVEMLTAALDKHLRPGQ
jgi:tetratricopeptide (TPR) repeat protein